MHDNASHLGRREVIRRLAMSVGGVVSLPFVARSHPIQHYLLDETTVAAADLKAGAADYSPEFLDAHQLSTVEVLAERIVPGSTEAKSAEFIDQLLAVATAGERQQFLQALGALQQLAIARARAPWTDLSEEQQNTLLTLASSEKPGTRGPGADKAQVTMRDHFDHIKGWIVGAYYSSEQGMRELGWRGTVFFPAFQGCDHAGGH